MLEVYIFITMNNFYKSTSIFVVGLFFLSMPAFSYNPGAQNCTDIEDPSERLSCYDALFQENKSIAEAKIIPKNTAVIKIDEQKTALQNLENIKKTERISFSKGI